MPCRAAVAVNKDVDIGRVFVEAKMGTGLLSDWQKLTQAEITRAGSRYVVLRFSDTGKTFVCSNMNGVHSVAGFRAEKFFVKGAK